MSLSKGKADAIFEVESSERGPSEPMRE